MKEEMVQRRFPGMLLFVQHRSRDQNDRYCTRRSDICCLHAYIRKETVRGLQAQGYGGEEWQP